MTYRPKACPCCGVVNFDYSIVKNGFILSKVKWISHTHYPTYLFLRKQRFLCRECQSSFLAESLEIEKHCFISRRVKQSVLFELSDATSHKIIDVLIDNHSKTIKENFLTYSLSAYYKYY
ncbi:transposase family protein [Enterococcus sp. DIV1314a]|uniref:transposase family protein n=1 Tax=Enterococcus sp. DIV1314a TaxID=2774660 RepID=UPI003F6871D7